MFMSRHQNAGQDYGIKILNKSIENVAKFVYLGMTVMNQNYINGNIKNSLNSGDASYHSV